MLQMGMLFGRGSVYLTVQQIIYDFRNSMRALPRRLPLAKINDEFEEDSANNGK